MVKNSSFANIRTYKELETSIRVLQRQKEVNRQLKGSLQATKPASGLNAGLGWAVILMLIRGLQKRLKK